MVKDRKRRCCSPWGHKEVDTTEQVNSNRWLGARPAIHLVLWGSAWTQEHPHRAVGSHLDVCWAPRPQTSNTYPLPPTTPMQRGEACSLLVWNPGPTWPFSPIFSAPEVSAQPALAEVCRPGPHPSQHPGQPSQGLGPWPVPLCGGPASDGLVKLTAPIGHIRSAGCLVPLVPLARHLGGGPPAAHRRTKGAGGPPSAGRGRWVWAGKRPWRSIREGLVPGSPLHLLTEVSGPASPLTRMPSLARGPSMGRPVLASPGSQLQVRTQNLGHDASGASAPGPPCLEEK